MIIHSNLSKMKNKILPNCYKEAMETVCEIFKFVCHHDIII